jgi:AcrR family transcriptional regulator
VARQRSTRAHQDVLDAALHLFAERGIERTSMDAIAEKSGVSKATIYKHWADKEALLLEVMTHAHQTCDRPNIDTGDTRRDLFAILRHKPEKTPGNDNALRERLMPHLMAYSAYNPKFGAAWRSMIMEPARREIRTVLTRAVANGEFPSDLDYDTAISLLLGPMLYRHIFEKSNPLPLDGLAGTVVDAFQSAFATGQKATLAKPATETRREISRRTRSTATLMPRR